LVPGHETGYEFRRFARSIAAPLDFNEEYEQQSRRREGKPKTGGKNSPEDKIR